MTKKDMRPQTIKQPLKMEVKVLVPWLIILVLAAFSFGAWTGWTTRSAQYSEIKAEVSAQLAQAQTAKK